MLNQPLEQFELYFLYSMWFKYCVSQLMLTQYGMTYFCVCVGFVLSSLLLHFSKITPKFFELIVETLFNFLIQLFRQNLSLLLGLNFFPLIFSIFLFILILNMVGLIPYWFTITSHIFFTFSLAFIYFGAVFILGFVVQKLNFLRLFLPFNVENKFLFAFICLIEIFSYCIRPFSLAIRLFANMLAGHTLLYILTNFFCLIFAMCYYIFASILLSFCFGVYFLEFCICGIQAYVFTILSILFLSDIYKLEH